VRKFIIQLAKFIAPIILFFLPPFVLLWVTAENFCRIDKLIISNQKYLIGYAYNQNNYLYLKWFRLVNLAKVDLLALGSSRVLQFRKEMFDCSFYNAGYAISSVKDFKPFLESIPREKYPKVLLINLDQWMFNENWDNLKGFVSDRKWADSYTKNASAKIYINFYKDLLAKKYSIGGLVAKSNSLMIGLNSVNDIGFRNDGSFNYGIQIIKLINNDSTAIDYLYKDTFRRILNGTERFEYSNEVNMKAISELQIFLEFCRKNNLYVVAFLPPFAEKVYLEMEHSCKYDYIKKLPGILTEIFEKYHFEFYNYTTIADCHSSDLETIDGFHGGEVTYLKILIDILNKNSKLCNVADINKLDSDLKDLINRYQIYTY
jgi:hypothetical protein